VKIIVGRPFEVFARGEAKGLVKIKIAADILTVSYVPDTRVEGSVCSANLVRLIRRSVVGNNELEILKRLRKNRFDRLTEKFFPIVDGQTDAHSRTFPGGHLFFSPGAINVAAL